MSSQETHAAGARRSLRFFDTDGLESKDFSGSTGSFDYEFEEAGDKDYLRQMEHELRLAIARAEAAEEQAAQLRGELQSARAEAEVARELLERMRGELESARDEAEVAQASERVRVLELEAAARRVVQLCAELDSARATAEGAEEAGRVRDLELEAWRHHGVAQPGMHAQQHLYAVADATLKGFVPLCQTSECFDLQSVVVTEVFRVANPQLWKKFQHKRHEVAQKLATRSVSWPGVNQIVPGCKHLRELFPYVELEDSANEALLLYGSTEEAVNHIVARGFDERFNKNGMYGRGVYFASEACKAAQHPGRGEVGRLILARVVLGRPFLAEGPLKVVPEDELGAPYDSAVVQPGTCNASAGQQAHWEFVVPRCTVQAYPELVIHYRLGA